MAGTNVNTQRIDILFAVELLSCSDSLVVCGGMGAFMDLHCTIELETEGQHN